MSDVKVKRKESVSRDEAANWLSLLSGAFNNGGHVEFPFGQGTVSLRIPEKVRAEFEIEVDGDEVEVEVEFKWSINHDADAKADHPAPDQKRTPNNKAPRTTTRTARSARR
jgi:amphi-Trp domain-containing protein